MIKKRRGCRVASGSFRQRKQWGNGTRLCVREELFGWVGDMLKEDITGVFGGSVEQEHLKRVEGVEC